MRSEGELAKYVKPHFDEARVQRLWNSLPSRPTPVAAPARILVMGAALIGTGALIVIALATARPAPPAELRSVVETGIHDRQTVTLGDGSTLVVDPSSRLEINVLGRSAVRLNLLAGAVDLDVAHVEGRAFSVGAAGFEVLVKGTHFRVALGQDTSSGKLTVSVERGLVEVRGSGGGGWRRQIAAGESWSAHSFPEPAPTNPEAQPADVADVQAGAPATPPPPPAPPAVAAVPSAADLVRRQRAPGVAAGGRGRSSAEPTSPADPSAPTFLDVVRQHGPGTAFHELGSTGFVEAVTKGAPEELLELADGARLVGRTSDAARSFDELRWRYRADPRAALAAFQLGRLRLDDLGDPAGAAEAFADALALAAPAAPFREDAEARLVAAFEALGPTAIERCRSARAGYLARHPGGVHFAVVAQRCNVH